MPKLRVTAVRREDGDDRLLLFHQDPMHSDEQFDQMREDVVARWGVADDRCTVAAEGAETVV